MCDSASERASEFLERAAAARQITVKIRVFDDHDK
jgi:hypothetical protein